ncbi:hypothetical protein [Mangrovicoccus algicola]|uniref:Uncharacterized protein n=1 Tax=Mangrovicoccus algicola TaxID=2771008 RepID=A0A8J6YTG1_9RHOB|nr:hypothetical protein [Mangrovicoccus algicola]MBE3637345.1 hypothetical protein [Mangrovicoccus algicola]
MVRRKITRQKRNERRAVAAILVLGIPFAILCAAIGTWLGTKGILGLIGAGLLIGAMIGAAWEAEKASRRN